MVSSHTTIQKPEYVRQRLREIGFWFVDIPRTSSTTLRQAFYRRHGKLFGRPSDSSGLGIGLVPPHVPAAEMRRQVGAELWDSLYSFSIVRNPFERLLSLYQFLRANGKLRQLTFGDYVGRLASGTGFDYHAHSMSNLGYLTGDRGRIIVTQIFRFENRDADIGTIANRTQCPELAQSGRKTYRTERRHYSAYYDAATRRRAETLFRDDLEYFGYRFEEA